MAGQQPPRVAPETALSSPDTVLSNVAEGTGGPSPPSKESMSCVAPTHDAARGARSRKRPLVSSPNVVTIHELDEDDSPAAQRPRIEDAVPQRASEDQPCPPAAPQEPGDASEEPVTLTVMDDKQQVRPALQRAAYMACIHTALDAMQAEDQEGRAAADACGLGCYAADEETTSQSSALRSEDDDEVRRTRYRRFHQMSRSVDQPLWINQELMQCKEANLASLVDSVRFGFDDSRERVDATGVVLNERTLACFGASLRRYAEQQMATASDTQTIGMYMPSEAEMEEHAEAAKDLQSYTRHTHSYDVFDPQHTDRLTFPFDNDEHLINMAYGPCAVDVHMACASDAQNQVASTVYVQLDQRKMMGFVVSDLRARAASDRARLHAWKLEHPDLTPGSASRDQCDKRLKDVELLLQGSLLPMHAIDHRWAPENRTYCGDGGVTLGNICSATARTRQDKWSTRAECNNLAALYIEGQYLQAKHVFELTARERALGSVLDFARAPGKEVSASALDAHSSQPCKRTQGFTNCLDQYRQEAQVCLRRARHLQLRYAAMEFNEYPAATAALVNVQIVCSALRQRLLTQKGHLESMQEKLAADKLRLSTLGSQYDQEAKRFKTMVVAIVTNARERKLLGELPVTCQALENASDAQLPSIDAFLRKHFSEKVANHYEMRHALKNSLHDRWWRLHNQIAQKMDVLRAMTMSYFFLRGRYVFEFSRLSVATSRVCLMLMVMPKIKNLIQCMTHEFASLLSDNRAFALWLHTFADMVVRMCIPGYIHLSEREIEASIALSNRATGMGCKHNVRAIVSNHIATLSATEEGVEPAEAAEAAPEALAVTESPAPSMSGDADYDDIMLDIAHATTNRPTDAVASVPSDDNSDGASWGNPSFPVQICARTLQLFLKDATDLRRFVDVARRRLELCRTELAHANVDMASKAEYRRRVVSLCRRDVVAEVASALSDDAQMFYKPTDDMVEDHGSGHPFGNPAIAGADNVKLGVAIEEELQTNTSLLRDLYYNST